MSERWADSVDRAREEIRAARALQQAGFPSQAVSRSFYAAAHVASAALLVVGETPATEAGVVAAFGRRVVGDGGVEYEDGRTLRKLFEDRNGVDRALLDAPQDEARKAIAAAERLVEVTGRWIAARVGVRHG